MTLKIKLFPWNRKSGFHLSFTLLCTVTVSAIFAHLFRQGFLINMVNSEIFYSSYCSSAGTNYDSSPARSVNSRTKTSGKVQMISSQQRALKTLALIEEKYPWKKGVDSSTAWKWDEKCEETIRLLQVLSYFIYFEKYLVSVKQENEGEL